MNLRFRLLAIPALATLGAVSAAYINPAAPGASHELEESATALHDYMHDAFPSSYGAHDMEESAGDLHDTLHDWDHGEASECDVVASRGEAGDAFGDMTSQFIQNGVFSDPGATSGFFDVFGDLATVWWYTLFAGWGC